MLSQAFVCNGKLVSFLGFRVDLREIVEFFLIGVSGDVDAGGSVSVGGSVNGDVEAGGKVSVGGDVSGNIDAGAGVTVEGDVSGDIDAAKVIVNGKREE